MWQRITLENALVQLPDLRTRTIAPRIKVWRVALPAMAQYEIDEWSNAASLASSGAWEVGLVANFMDVGLVSQLAVNAIDAVLVDAGFPLACLQADTNAMGCTGSTFHSDSQAYGDKVFCIIWLSDDTAWDLYFPVIDRRVPLTYGTIVLFDSAMPHGVVASGASVFDHTQFEGNTGVFGSKDVLLTPAVCKAMGISVHSRRGRKGHVILNAEGTKEEIDEETGTWNYRKLR